jgi:hypothetical protein
VVGESSGGDGEAEGKGNAEVFVILKVHHAWPEVDGVEDEPEEEQEEQIEAIRDFAEVDQRPGYGELNVEDGEKEHEGAEEDEKRPRGGAAFLLRRVCGEEIDGLLLAKRRGRG